MRPHTWSATPTKGGRVPDTTVIIAAALLISSITGVAASPERSTDASG